MTSHHLAAALLLPVALFAQEGDYGSAAAAQRALSARLQEQSRAFYAAREALTGSEAFRAASAAGDQQETARLLATVARPDPLVICREAVAVASRFEDDDAVRLLGWAAVKSRDRDLVRQVVARLEREHMESPALTSLLERADVLAGALGRADGAKFLARVVAESPHDVVKAWSLYWQSVAIARRDAATAAVLRERAAELARDHWLADKIRAPEFQRERLQVGMTAPDIAGEDLDGVAFQLSDYRGKVVVLDFWGFW